MALSLFRKYRPETFADVVGQQHIEQTLSRAIANDQTAAAYLFCGPRGTGKTSTARLLAKGLLCEHPQDGEPDDSCPQCREISLGIHPDVYELDAASRTGVDNVREEIISRVAFAPTRGRYKIYIIDEVHMLSTAAFNALLKTLEEPPPHIRFVLCTTDAHRVPDTIQSRCQRFDFHRLGTAELVGRLQHICDAEGFKADDEALALIAAHARGGMRDAIVSLEQIAVFGDGTVSEDAATSLLGNVPADQLRSLAALIAARDIAACFVWIAEFSQKGTDIAQFARSLTRHLRDIYVLILLSDSGSANASGLFSQEGEELASLQGQAAGFSSSEHLAYCLQVMTDLNQQLKTDADPRLALELALVRMADPRGEQSVAALSVRLADLEKRLESSDAVLVPIASAIPQSLPHSAPVAARPAAPANPPGQAATAAAPPAAPPGQAATAAAPPAAPAAATAAAPPAAPPGQAATAAAPPTATAAAPPAAPPGQAATAAAPPAAPAAAPPAAPAAAPAALGATPLLHDDNDACRLWQALLRRLQSDKELRLLSLLTSAQASKDPDCNGLLVELPVTAQFALSAVEEKESRAQIERRLGEQWGAPVALRFKLAERVGHSPSTPESFTAMTDEPTTAPGANMLKHQSVESVVDASFGIGSTIELLEADPESLAKPEIKEQFFQNEFLALDSPVVDNRKDGTARGHEEDDEAGSEDAAGDGEGTG